MAIIYEYIAQVIYFISRPHNTVPPLDHVLVHLFNAAETAASDQSAISVREPEHVLMPKMRIRNNPDVIHFILYPIC